MVPLPALVEQFVWVSQITRLARGFSESSDVGDYDHDGRLDFSLPANHAFRSVNWHNTGNDFTEVTLDEYRRWTPIASPGPIRQ
jgi:hypothetical protein